MQKHPLLAFSHSLTSQQSHNQKIRKITLKAHKSASLIIENLGAYHVRPNLFIPFLLMIFIKYALALETLHGKCVFISFRLISCKSKIGQMGMVD